MFKVIKNEKGFSLVMLALSVIVLFGFGALAIDVGHLYEVKDQLQVAADAAALAGAAKLDGTSDPAQTAARDEAQRIAALNFADVAPAAVPVYGQSPGAAVGSPIPVALQLPQGAGDIIVGNWDGTTFTPADGIITINAVEVNARRLGAVDAQPETENWFSKIFTLLGSNYDFSGITAVAIAARENLKLVPITVNEYWNEPNGGTGPPYNQSYPDSFVRQFKVTVNGQPENQPSPVWRNTFAILGANAGPNDGSKDPNGYVDLDQRSISYDDSLTDANGNKAYSVAAGTGSCSTDCGNPNVFVPGGGKDQSAAHGTGLTYLANGYPADKVPPTSVYEVLRTPADYSNNKFSPYYSSPYPGNSPSPCPYATLWYFEGGGKDPINLMDTANEYRAGQKFMAMVYDGTHNNGGQTKLVTIVGYVPIEIDGYDNGGGGGSPAFKTYAQDPSYAYNKSLLNPTSGNTMYGHALSDIIQPSQLDPNGGCTNLTETMSQFSNVRLVGPNLKYGVINH